LAALPVVIVVVVVELPEVVVVVEPPDVFVVAELAEVVVVAELFDVVVVVVEARGVVVLSDSLKGSEDGPPHPTARIARPASTAGIIRFLVTDRFSASRFPFRRTEAHGIRMSPPSNVGSPLANETAVALEGEVRACGRSDHLRPHDEGWFGALLSQAVGLLAGETIVRRRLARDVDVS